MDTFKILDRLSSSDEEEVLRALYELGGYKHPTPIGPVIPKLLEMLRNFSADIRERAAFDLGIHWKVREAYEPIFSMLQAGEDDEEVRSTLISALASLTHEEWGNVAQSSRYLAAVALNRGESAAFKGKARLQLLRIHGRITPAEYGNLCLKPAEVPEDREWLQAFVHG